MLSLCNTAPKDLNNVSFVRRIITELTKLLSALHQRNFLGTEKVYQWLFIHILFQRPEVKLTLRHTHTHTCTHISISTAAQNVNILDWIILCCWGLSHALINVRQYLWPLPTRCRQRDLFWPPPMVTVILWMSPGGQCWTQLRVTGSRDVHLLSTSFSGNPSPHYKPEQRGTHSGRCMIHRLHLFVFGWHLFNDKTTNYGT